MAAIEAMTPGRGSVLRTIGGITTAIDRESHCTPSKQCTQPKALWWWSHGGRISKNRHGAENIHSRYELIDGGSRGGRGHNAFGWRGSASAATGKNAAGVSCWEGRGPNHQKLSQSCHLILKLSHSRFIVRMINHFLLLIPV